MRSSTALGESRPIRKSPRRKGYDYGQAASYLVTVAVDDREWRFGEVEHGTMHPNDAGQLVEAAWLRLSERFASIELDQYVVMPNHFHGIILLGTDPEHTPPTLIRVMQVFKSESAVAYGRGIRSGLFPNIRRALWQRSFHDNVLQGVRTLEMARTYIEDNPQAWQAEMDRRRELQSGPDVSNDGG